MNKKTIVHVDVHVISAEIFSKRRANNFSQVVDNCSKEKIVICKSYIYESKKIDGFFQS